MLQTVHIHTRLAQKATLDAVPAAKPLVCLQVRSSADKKAITAIASADGEVVELCSPVTATEAVEAWLHQLTDGMRAALQASLRGFGGLSNPFAQAPAQVLGLYHALTFTER